MPKMTAKSFQAVEDLGMNWTPEQKKAYQAGLKTVYIKRLEEPYPIKDSFAAGTEKAREEWEDWWADKPLREKKYEHKLRPEIFTLDTSRLQYIVPKDESVIFRDADTKQIFFVVLRNLISDDEVRETMISTCGEIIKYRRNDRRSDPGQLVHFGYTSGSRDRPLIRLAGSIPKVDTIEAIAYEEDLDRRTQGMAGIIWNLMKCRLPAVVVDDYNNTIKKNDFPRMDMHREDNNFYFKIGGEEVTFETGENGLELPPPSGMSAINYARYTHNEVNGNDWIVACTCKAPDDHTKGGNFYIASYGIMLLPCSNTVTAWTPGEYHGTTLYEMKEGPVRRTGHECRADGAINTGIVFEISVRLKSARQRATWLNDWKKDKKVAKVKSVKARSKPPPAKKTTQKEKPARKPASKSLKRGRSPPTEVVAKKEQIKRTRYGLRRRKAKPIYTTASDDPNDPNDPDYS